MGRVGFIALNTYRETVRDKVLYNLVLFALLIIASSYVLSQIAVHQEVRIIKDLGLASISIFGMAISIFIGIGLVSKEMEKRTLYSLLSKPISRAQFILGKYLGLCLTLLVNVVIMTVGLYLLLFILDRTIDLSLLPAIFLIYISLAVLTAVSLLFSTFTSSMLAGLFSGFVYIAGYLSADLKNFDAVVSGGFVPMATRVLYYLLPNFRNFDVKAAAVAGDPIPLTQVALATGYGVVYVAIALVGAVFIFQRRNLK